MKAIFRTEEVISFLEFNDCHQTAQFMKENYSGFNFIDAKLVKREIVNELWPLLLNSVSTYSYTN